ncbi:MAG: phosphonate transport system permease protein [Planctomycetota bacterium]|jgi:phosphonate transport system permease protein
MSTEERQLQIAGLWQNRPRSIFLRVTLIALTIWTLYSWASADIAVDEFLTQRRLSNLAEFLRNELIPFPLRTEAFTWGGLWEWISGIWNKVGATSTLATLQISILAIVLAAAASWPLAALSARNFSSVLPFEPTPRASSKAARLFWFCASRGARAIAILLRAIPEYILAFLFLAVLGPANAWPAVLALAIHNSGILARLGGEVIENLEPQPLRCLALMGARRPAILIFGIVPLTLGRNLLYFFYRFETCVREATVLGMLGVVSLGYWIQDARSKQYYDEMLLLVLFGVGLVLVADLLSALARRSLRRG